MLRLSCVVLGPIYGRFMGFYVNVFIYFYIFLYLHSDWSTRKQKFLRHGNRLAARVRRRYFSEGEKRRPEMRLRFAG